MDLQISHTISNPVYTANATSSLDLRAVEELQLRITYRRTRAAVPPDGPEFDIRRVEYLDPFMQTPHYWEGSPWLYDTVWNMLDGEEDGGDALIEALDTEANLRLITEEQSRKEFQRAT